MPENTAENTDQPGQGPANAPNPDQLVRQVAEQVWALWLEEMRLERERRSAIVRR